MLGIVVNIARTETGRYEGNMEEKYANAYWIQPTAELASPIAQIFNM